MSNNVACIAERSACVIRVTRLGQNCEPLTGPTDGAILTAISTINLTGDVEEGTRFEPKDAVVTSSTPQRTLTSSSGTTSPSTSGRPTSRRSSS